MFHPGGAVFLDRDGTIVDEVGYVTHPDQLVLLAGAAEAIARFNTAKVPVLVVSNQAAVAHGLISERELEAIHMRLIALLGSEGARVDGIYYCPHHPEGKIPQYSMACDCRKPAPGLIERAAREHSIALVDSVLIGDALRDLQAGRATGMRTMLVRTGLGLKTLDGRATLPEADWVVGDLAEAAEILNRI